MRYIINIFFSDGCYLTLGSSSFSIALDLLNRFRFSDVKSVSIRLNPDYND